MYCSPAGMITHSCTMTDSGQQEGSITDGLLRYGKAQSSSGGLEVLPTAPFTSLSPLSATNGRPKLEILDLNQAQVPDSSTASVPDLGTIVIENASSKSWGQLVILFKCRTRFAKARTGGRPLDTPGEEYIYRVSQFLVHGSLVLLSETSSRTPLPYF